MSAIPGIEGVDLDDYAPYGAPTIAGDPHDDDGQVIDSFLIETDAPPAPVVEPIDAIKPAPPKAPTQLVSGFQIIDVNIATIPIQIVRADPNRTSLIVRVNGTVVTDHIRVADAQNKLAYPGVGGNSGLSGKLFTGGSLTLDAHTGEVWVSGPEVTGTVIVSYWGVTK